MVKDQELQKLILHALKWNAAGKPIESQLERLKNASFRGVSLDAAMNPFHWILPNREFRGQLEYLYYQEDVKENVSK